MPLTVDGDHARLLAAVNGARSVRQCIERARGGGDQALDREPAREFFRTLWRLGYVYFAIPS